MLSGKDFDQISSKGISMEQIEGQFNSFEWGFPFINLDRPATPGDGIFRLEQAEIKSLEKFYEKNLSGLKLLKFVPASGAASRMFKDLFALAKGSVNKESEKTFENISHFAFFKELTEVLQNNNLNIEEETGSGHLKRLSEYIIEKKGLNYGQLPKGLLSFHQYGDYSRTAFEEHLVEAALYCKNKKGKANIHFTVSPDHLPGFQKKFNEVRQKYQQEFDVNYEVNFSVQKPSTDTIAVDLDNNPFRSLNGSLLFRPGGHGALIENLYDIKADIIFIKNIDNIVPDRLKPDTILYKKVLGGLLLSLKDQIFKYLSVLENGLAGRDVLNEILIFAKEKLLIDIIDNFINEEDQRKSLFNALNKPFRICGMVKNEGEPGGGPFWVKGPDGKISLQIVESSQINFDDHSQKKIVHKSTHFNPVDLVCSAVDFKGNSFDLHSYIDSNTGFISQKSKDGRDLKALELPGLWNGAMSDWITLFVEVPVSTFNPVKAINDLLREQHQP